MNFIDYCNAAPVTANDKLSKLEQLTHACYGIITEIGEVVDVFKRERFYGLKFERDKFIKEIGDVMWYVALAVWELNDHKVDENSLPRPLSEKPLEFDYSAQDKELPWNMTVSVLTQQTLNAIRSIEVSGVMATSAYKELKAPMQETMFNIIEITRWLLNSMNSEREEYFTLEECMERNIEKLKARFPEGFTVQHAVNRDESKE